MASEADDESVGVVMLAYGEEPVIDQAIRAVVASSGITASLVVVDNGCTRTDLVDLCRRHGVTLVTPGKNLGFAGGVNFGARHVRDRFLALVNSDAVVKENSLARLVATLGEPSIGIASGSIRLASNPELMNSAGNPVHLLGLSWAGGLDEPAGRYDMPRDVASASGAGLVMRRELWERLGGFPAEFFAYQEDLELSWRTWQLGLRVRYVPDAVVLHYYEFSRNHAKMYLLERNRLLFVLTCYGRRTLALLSPALLAFEVAMLAVAIAQGWGSQKVKGWSWVARHVGWVRSRRRLVQSLRTIPDSELVGLWSDRFTPAALPLPSWGEPLQRLLAAYWRLVRRWL